MLVLDGQRARGDRGARRGAGAVREVLCYASPLRLYAEEIEPASGRQLGNFPQAFTHLALINALMHVIRADDELVRGEPLVKTRRREVVKK